MKLFDCIAAISTPIGTGGVAVIRVSGEEAVKTASKIVYAKNKKNLSEFESHKLVLSDIKAVSEDGSPSHIIDEALAVVMKAPHSYTGEDVVEIQCHGGYISARRILSELIKAGARPAEAGEFTRRAFINGKTDLVRVEATAELIHSTSYLGAENAAKAVTGQLSEKINAIRSDAVMLASHLSAVCDYPDEADELTDSELISKITNIDERIDKLLSGFDTGKLLREGVRTLIIGRPNVGKSSVLNALLREERAIVTDIPGTTRDIIEELASIGGITLRLMDTAGIRRNADAVEKIGIDRAVDSIDSADLCLFVLDSSKPISSDDINIYEKLKHKKHIILLNKSDLSSDITPAEAAMAFSADISKIVKTSVPYAGEASISELESKIEAMFLTNDFSPSEVYITGERQRDALLRAKKACRSIIESIKAITEYDLIFIDLEDIISSLGEITGETVQDEIIDSVFKNFCVGK